MTRLTQVDAPRKYSQKEVNNRRVYRSLEMLRAICALVVFGNHLFSKVDGAHTPMIASVVFNYATEAVICFFVLSGCVIALQNYPSKKAYLKARAVRILPIYYFSIAFTVLVMTLASQSVKVKSVVGNVFFLQTLQGDIVSPLSFNAPLWSLSYEAFYYLLFALILWRPRFFKVALLGSILLGISTYAIPVRVGLAAFIIRVGSLFCIWLLGVLAVRSFRRGVTVSTTDAVLLVAIGFCLSRVWLSKDFYDFFRLSMFGVGCTALCSSLLGEESISANLRSVAPKTMPVFLRLTLAVAVGTIFWSKSPSLHSTKITLLIGLAAATLIPRLIAYAVRRAITVIASPLSTVGKLSYALYLVHYPMIELVNYSLRRMPTIGKMLSAAAASILLAYFLDLIVQKRIRQWINERGAPVPS